MNRFNALCCLILLFSNIVIAQNTAAYPTVLPVVFQAAGCILFMIQKKAGGCYAGKDF